MAVRLIYRLSLTAALLLCLSMGASQEVAPARTTMASSAFYPEVRLRKLHLVRPDLIPYPIYYKIYC